MTRLDLDPTQNLGLRPVREADVLEAHLECSSRQMPRVGRLRQRLDALEPREASPG